MIVVVFFALMGCVLLGWLAYSFMCFYPRDDNGNLIHVTYDLDVWIAYYPDRPNVFCVGESSAEAIDRLKRKESTRQASCC